MLNGDDIDASYMLLFLHRRSLIYYLLQKLLRITMSYFTYLCCNTLHEIFVILSMIAIFLI